MRVRDIILESYSDQIRDEITNLLSIAHARSMKSVPTTQLIIDLRKLGYAIDQQTIGEILDDIELVSDYNSKSIRLNGISAEPQEVSDVTSIEDIMSMSDNAAREPEVDPIDAAALRKSKKDMNL